MPRHPRLFVPGATYHVHCRVARGEFVFDDRHQADQFVRTVREVRDLDGWTVLAWCLMANHYHLVVQTRTVDLWRSMARLQGTVSRYHNKRKKYRGRLWESRYRARVIDTQDYFRQVVAYVHLNPVAAGAVQDPADYTFSGHRELLGQSRRPLVDRSRVFRGFGYADASNPAQCYLEWVRFVAEARWAGAAVDELPWWIQAGHADEIADVDRHPKAKNFDGSEPADQRVRLPLGEFLGRFQSLSGHSLHDIASRRLASSITCGRIELATLAVARYGFSAREIAEHINKHPTSMTRWLNIGLRSELEDPSFKNRLDHLDAAISRPTHPHGRGGTRSIAPEEARSTQDA